MFSLFRSQPLLDEGSRQWIFDAFHWALTHFDADLFAKQTTLVLPTNAFFPGNVSSVEQMSQVVFDKVKLLSQIQHWPITLVQPARYEPPQTMLLPSSITSRATELTTHSVSLPVSFHPAQLNKPQDLIANFAVQLANYVANNIHRQPPGGQQFWPQAVELLAIYFGFGIMMANSAYTFRGGCGSCYNQAANREAALPENESVYALALFCLLKDIEPKQAATHLKPYLKADFKKAVREISKKHQQELTQLKQLIPAKFALES